MGRKPDYNLSMYDPDTGDRNNRLGVAWAGEDGRLSVRLHPGVCLTYENTRDFQLVLFPADDGLPPPKKKPVPKKRKRPTPTATPDATVLENPPPKCEEVYGGDRCLLPAGHDGKHSGYACEWSTGEVP